MVDQRDRDENFWRAFEHRRTEEHFKMLYDLSKHLTTLSTVAAVIMVALSEANRTVFGPLCCSLSWSFWLWARCGTWRRRCSASAVGSLQASATPRLFCR